MPSYAFLCLLGSTPEIGWNDIPLKQATLAAGHCASLTRSMAQSHRSKRGTQFSSKFSSKFSSSFQLSNFPTFSKFFYGEIQSSVSSVSSISCVATFFLVKLQSSNVIAHPRLSSCSAKHARRRRVLCAPISCGEVLLCRRVQRATHLRTQRGCAFGKKDGEGKNEGKEGKN